MRWIAASLAVAGLMSGCIGSSRTTPLITAVESGTTEDVKRVLDSGAKVNEKDYANSTALFSAAGLGGLEKLNLLLDRGADIKQQGTGGYTVLMAAAAGRMSVDVIHRLLNAGADPCVRATKGPFKGLRASQVALSPEAVRPTLRAEVSEALETAEQSCPA
jgi:ankyrin repeat protein